jgi:flagellar biosynthesis/type III secretory pathway protein FliH
MNVKASKFDKFVFETDFFEVAVNEKDKAEERVLTENDLAQAQSKGYAEGLEKGQQQALEQFQSELASYLVPLKEKLEQFVAEKSALHTIMEKRSLAVVSQTVALLFKHLEKELGEETLAAAISQTLEKVMLDVHIIVKVNQNAYDFLQKHDGIKSLLSSKDAELRVDENLSKGECSLEWEEAGADINLVSLTQEIQATLHDLLPKIITAPQAEKAVEKPVVEDTPKPEAVVEEPKEPNIPEEIPE